MLRLVIIVGAILMATQVSFARPVAKPVSPFFTEGTYVSQQQEPTVTKKRVHRHVHRKHRKKKDRLNWQKTRYAESAKDVPLPRPRQPQSHDRFDEVWSDVAQMTAVVARDLCGPDRHTPPSTPLCW